MSDTGGHAAPETEASRRPWSVAVDRGGTFTDIVARGADGTVLVRKVPTDGSDAGRTNSGGTDREGAAAGRDSAVDAIRQMCGAPGDLPIGADFVSSVRCGTTVATNALLERRGEPCALLVTAGFADLLTIGSGERPDLFALDIRRPPPLARHVIEISERVLADGTLRTSLDEDAVRAAAHDLRTRGVASVAVVFLHAYAHPEHEARAAAILREVGIPHVVASHEAAREVRVVPRGSTTVADAYLTPLLRRSLARFRSAFAGDVDVRFMQSHGGLCDASHAVGPRAVLSGPAGGVVAARAIARRAGIPRVIAFDMGGTSTDVSRWAGEDDLVYETRAGGIRLQVPALRIETVAAGGGSRLAYDGRRLLVGPESVGAAPGPAGYGIGTEPALTDANAVLGRIQPSTFPQCFGADGRAGFDVAASRRAVAPLAARAGMRVEDAALGFVRVAVERMAQAIREVSVQRGHDVRDHALVCFGGAAGQHACALAVALGMRTVIVHSLGSVLSAWGIGKATSSHEEVEALLLPWDEDARRSAAERAWTLMGRARAVLVAERVAPRAIEARAFVELRYVGLDHGVAVPLVGPRCPRAAFDAAHARLFGFARPAAAVECVAVRVRATELDVTLDAGAGDSDHDERAASSVPLRPRSPRSRRVPVWFPRAADGVAESLDTPLVPLLSIEKDDAIDGPALVVDDVTTLLVEPGWTVRRDAGGLLRLTARDVPEPPRATIACDPLHLALFGNAFMSIAERMGALLERVSHSTSIKERLDFSCAVFDGAGRLVANAPHIPVHLGAMGESVRAIAAARGWDLRDGDALVTNDPLAGGSHLPDITVVTPVLVRDGVPAFWIANRAHHADVGGITPGSMPPMSTTIEDEGVRIHDLLLVRDGTFADEDVTRVLSSGAYPARGLDERLADLRAQAAANAEGARLLADLAARHGRDVVTAYMAHVLDDGALAMRELLEGLPDGAYAATDRLDDGTPLEVVVTVAGDTVAVDFAGTGPRSRGNSNAPRAVTRAAVLYALRTLFGRSVPLNEGCLRPVEIRIPLGSLLDPAPSDAVVGGNVETSMRVVDVVLRALGAVAGSQGTMNNVAFGRSDGRGGAYYETIGGGAGAGPTFDGASAVQCHMTNTRITDPEVLELRWPVVLRGFGVRRGSGGAGAHRGGDGAVREIEAREALSGGILSDRRSSGAPGLHGGCDGAPGRNTLIRDGRELVLPGRAALELRSGDVLRIETPGGGGCGPASDAAPERTPAT